MTTINQNEWLSAFKAEYRRRTGITTDSGGLTDEDALNRYYPNCSPNDGVVCEMDRYSLVDITAGWEGSPEHNPNEVVPERDYLGDRDVVARALHMALESLNATTVPQEWDCRQVIREAIRRTKQTRDKIVRKAQDHYASDEVQISDDAEVEQVDGGYWVNARVYVGGWELGGGK